MPLCTLVGAVPSVRRVIHISSRGFVGLDTAVDDDGEIVAVHICFSHGRKAIVQTTCFSSASYVLPNEPSLRRTASSAQLGSSADGRQPYWSQASVSQLVSLHAFAPPTELSLLLIYVDELRHSSCVSADRSSARSSRDDPDVESGPKPVPREQKSPGSTESVQTSADSECLLGSSFLSGAQLNVAHTRGAGASAITHLGCSGDGAGT